MITLTREEAQQPIALRLADILQYKIPSIECLEIAAAELRRLHEVNAELVEALKMLTAECLDGFEPHEVFVNQGLAAIRKATGEQQ